jgi:hypothetical protein
VVSNADRSRCHRAARDSAARAPRRRP